MEFSKRAAEILNMTTELAVLLRDTPVEDLLQIDDVLHRFELSWTQPGACKDALTKVCKNGAISYVPSRRLDVDITDRVREMIEIRLAADQE
jgi:hypothetical protein